jgi:hypothetical protein
MPLFGHRKHQGQAAPGVPGLAEAAAARGLYPAADPLFGSRDLSVIHQVSRTLHEFRARPLNVREGLPPMFCSDAYRGSINGATVTVANVWTPMETADLRVAAHVHATSLVALELPTIVPLQGIEPRQKFSAFGGSDVPTGNPAFDARFRVVPLLGFAPEIVTPAVQTLVLAQSAWTFAFHDTTLFSIAEGEFVTTNDVTQRLDNVLAIVAAFPASIVPRQIDHSVDDLIVRFNQLHSVDEAIVFLQNLSDDDRARLAASPTPLAKFADVRNRDEITMRFLSLPETERLQILAMFGKAGHEA